MDNSIVVNGVTYYRVLPVSEDLAKLKENYDWLAQEIREAEYHARTTYEQMKDMGLSIGMVEAEGFLRATKNMVATLDYIENGGN